MLIVIIPTYNAEKALSHLLPQLDGVRIIVSEGGSQDQTVKKAVKGGAVLAIGATGRGAQLRLGASLARLSGQPEDWFLFLHADSHLSHNWRDIVETAMHQARPRYFRYRAGATGLRWRLMDILVGWRSDLLGLPYGDQGLLISRQLYEQVGGYADMPLFEDVDMIERLRRVCAVRSLPASLRTDVSGYEREGLFRRGISNLKLLRRYKKGARIEDLLRDYQR